jgi:hypothetical protein
MTTKCTNGGCKPNMSQCMPGAGFSWLKRGKALPEMPAFQPYRGKPAVRNDGKGRGNDGIIRSPGSRLDSTRCVKPKRLSRKVQTSSGGSHALRSTCASGTRHLAQHRFQLYSSRLSIGGRVTHGRNGFVFDDHCPSHQHQNLSDDAKTPRRATFTLGRN